MFLYGYMMMGIFGCGEQEQTEKQQVEIAVQKKEASPQKDAPPPKETAITESNWKQHPGIVEIRTLVSGFSGPKRPKRWSEMSHTFQDMCGEHGIFKIQLSYPEEGEPLAIFQMVEIHGDVSRDTKMMYDAKGNLRFLMSEYTHSSAESNYLSRAYFKNGALLYSPKVEQKSKKGGPQDEKKEKDLALLTAEEAEKKFFATAQKCSTQ